MPDVAFQVRPARDDDRLPLAELFAAVAEERDGIATEPPVDLDARAASWELEWIVRRGRRDEVIGLVHLDPSRFGYCDIALAVARELARPRRRHGAPRDGASPRLATAARTSSASPSSPTTPPRSPSIASSASSRRGARQAVPAPERRALGLGRDGPPALTTTWAQAPVTGLPSATRLRHDPGSPPVPDRHECRRRRRRTRPASPRS